MRGPNVFQGYLNRPDATEEAMRDGWFMTGDMATRDPAGSLRLVGRKSTDLIKSGGYRIGAGEIEGALLEHPAVAEVAVTAKPDEDLGERIVAWVVLEPDAERGARRAVRPRGEPPDEAQTPSGGPLRWRAAAERHGQGHEALAHRPVTPGAGNGAWEITRV